MLAFLPGWALSILSALGGVFLNMFMKLIGYDFITKAAIATTNEWSKTTATHLDDQLVAAAAKAWDVDPSVLNGDK